MGAQTKSQKSLKTNSRGLEYQKYYENARLNNFTSLMIDPINNRPQQHLNDKLRDSNKQPYFTFRNSSS